MDIIMTLPGHGHEPANLKPPKRPATSKVLQDSMWTMKIPTYLVEGM